MSWSKAEAEKISRIDRNTTSLIKAVAGDLDTGAPGLQEEVRDLKEDSAANKADHKLFRIALALVGIIAVVAASDRVYVVIKGILEIM